MHAWMIGRIDKGVFVHSAVVAEARASGGLITPGLDTPEPVPLKGEQPTVRYAYSRSGRPPDPPKSGNALYTKRAGMERAWCTSTTPGSVVHLAQGLLGPSTDLNAQRR